MKIKKNKIFSNKSQIWRLLISSSDKLIVETRDTENKQAHFSVVDLAKGKVILDSFQFEEKFWLGIEAVEGDLIVLHKFAKPDMPGHKEVFVFNTVTEKVVWENPIFTFIFIYNGNVVVSQDKMDGKWFFLLDINSGEILEEFGKDDIKINEMRITSQNQISYGDYNFPEKSNLDILDEPMKSVAQKHIGEKKNVGELETIDYNSFFMFNYHSKVFEGILQNSFAIVNKDKEKIVFSEILNSGSKNYVPDSFFTYKENLILIKEKTKVLLYKIKE